MGEDIEGINGSVEVRIEVEDLAGEGLMVRVEGLGYGLCMDLLELVQGFAGF